MKKLLVIDGNSIINRAFFGVKPLTNSTGLFVHAIYGMINIVNKNIENISPDYCAVAFDLHAPTFRHKMFSGYKSTRKPMPNELKMQMPYAKQAMESLGITIVQKEGYEADDVLGTLSMFAENHDNLKAYILSGDRDLLQLVSNRVNVLLATTGETVVVDPEEFVNRYPGITPITLVDAKALMGDSSDNIPGVPGIGEKTALKFISKYQTLQGVYEFLDNNPLGDETIKGANLKKLFDGKESAFLSYDLAKICRAVPIDITLDQLKYNGPTHDIVDLCNKLELFSLSKKFSTVIPSTNDEISTFDRELIKCEFVNSEISTDKIDLLPVAISNTNMYAMIDNKIYPLSRDKLLSYNGKILILDSKALYHCINTTELSGDIFDIQLAAYVVDSSMGRYDISRLAMTYLQESVDEEDFCSYLSVYPRLYSTLKDKLNESNQYKLYSEIELPLSCVLYEMEKTGFHINRKGLAEYGNQLQMKLNEVQKNIYEIAGEEFNINSPKQLGIILFEKLGLPASKKTKTGYSTGAEVLEKLAEFYPIVKYVLEYRQLSKIISTYVEGLINACDDKGVVHSVFNQTITATGRLSSSEPNLQNIPIRTEIGKELRKYFTPRNENFVFVDADYSQIELRILAAISGDNTMISAFENNIDIHSKTASQVFNVPEQEVTPELRKKAKAVNFGIMYGIGAFSLSKDLNVSLFEAKQYIDYYMSGFPSIKQYLDNTIASAKSTGYVTTIFGRRRNIPELSSSKKMMQAFGERVAMNSPIQGAAADIIKIAMVNVSKRLQNEFPNAKLILQVHDELIIECDRSDSRAVTQLLAECMENAVNLPVKLTVESGTGSTWFECK